VNLTSPPDAAGRWLPTRVIAGDLGQRPVGVQGRRMVVVAGDGEHPGTGAGQRDQGVDHQFLRGGTGRGAVVEVAGDQHRVGLLAAGDTDDLAQHGGLLVEPVVALECLADVPVGSVQESHGAPTLGGGPDSPAPDTPRPGADPGTEQRRPDLVTGRCSTPGPGTPDCSPIRDTGL